MAPSASLSRLSLGPPRRVAADKFHFFTGASNGTTARRRRRRSLSTASASNNKDSYDGKVVDQSMIVLRLRIREIQMKMKEMKEMNGGGRRMVEWERRYWEENYASDICGVLGSLQNLLMETRPCLALALLLLVFLSLSISMSLSLLHLVGLGKHIFMSHY